MKINQSISRSISVATVRRAAVVFARSRWAWRFSVLLLSASRPSPNSYASTSNFITFTSRKSSTRPSTAWSACCHVAFTSLLSLLCVELHLTQTSNETRPFVRGDGQERPSYGWTKRPCFREISRGIIKTGINQLTHEIWSVDYRENH